MYTSIQTTRAANWTFTINNPDGLPTAHDFEPDSIEYMVYQEELAPETGTLHLQGYIRFRQRVAFALVRASLGGLSPHLEVAKGTPQQNKEYCTKTTFPGAERYEYGTCPSQSRGNRTDLEALRAGVKEGKTFMELVDDDHILPTLARCIPFYTRLTQEAQPPVQRPDTTVRLCVGPAGTGKSTCAGLFDSTLNAYPYDRALNGFWDGYINQPTVIFDEMSGSVMSPTEFNRICDKGPYRVNIKNGSTWLRATDIRITSNFTPEHWWSDKVKWNREALSRRITEVHYHSDLETVKIWNTKPGSDALTQAIGHFSLSGLDGRF